MAYQLKPFVINLGDLAFLLKQINFKPLFDSQGNAVVNWDGVGSVFTANNTEIIGGTVAGDAAAVAAIGTYGVGFPSTTAPIGIRDIAGYHNNLYGTQAQWGNTDLPFVRLAPADYGNYVTSPGANYTPGSGVGSSGSDVIDGAPRMISRTITTGGVNLLVDGAGHFVEWRAAKYGTDGTDGTDPVYGALINASGVNVAQLVEGAKIVAPAGLSLAWDATADSASIMYATLLTYIAGGSTLVGSETGGPLVDGGAMWKFDGATYTPLNGLTFDANLFVYHSLVAASGVTTSTLAAGDAIALTPANVATAISALTILGDVAPATVNALLNSDSGYGLLETLGHIDYQNPTSGEFFIGSENPGVAPVNSWFAIFGQFFDHGLDKLGAGGNGKITIALDSSDPLYGIIGSNGQPTTSITVTRATIANPTDVLAGADPTYINHTSPFIDQSQTYGSHEQLTNLLRKWVDPDGNGIYQAGMELLDGTTLADAWERRWPDGSSELVWDTLPTLAELNAHLIATNRDPLTWDDVLNLRNRDASGHVIGGESGSPLLLDMNPHFDANHVTAAHLGALNTALGSTVFTATSLSYGALIGAGLIDPSTNLINTNYPAYLGGGAIDATIQAAVSNVLLDSVGDHYIAGDGRVNENFGLTTIHHVFHEEHNYQVENLKTWIYAHDANNPGTIDVHAGLHDWQTVTALQDDFGNYMFNATDVVETLDVNGDPSGLFRANPNNIAWDLDKMFNGTKLIVEMEYQHAAIDQYARTITPRIQEFVGYSSSVDPTISLEYAQVAFRFGHSTIRETIDTIDPSGWFKGHVTSYALEAAFLAPQIYAQEGVAAITLGLSRQQMSEVDEFITPALNQGLLGQPLDLAAINIARGRDMGIPTLNDFRAAIGLARYVSWSDFGLNMIHPESLVNFIAAYSFDGDVAKATEIMALADGTSTVNILSGLTVSQAIAFMHNDVTGGAIAGADGFNHIDSWMGGLAEAHVPGGLLGETFDAVFVAQMQALMDGDRFYYLYRLFGTQIGEEVNNGQFKDIVERNTGLSHLNGSIFAYADKYYDFGLNTSTADNFAAHEYANLIDLNKFVVNGTDNSGNANVGIGMFSEGGASTANNGAIITIGGIKYINDIRPELDPTQVHPVEGTPTSGADSHEVIVGTEYRDYIEARGGDDTIYGEGGDDILNGGGGIDRIYGGAGNDLIDTGEGPDLADGGAGDDTIYGRGSGSEVGGFDQLVGGGGNDLIIGGEGIDKISGGAGDDVIFGDGIINPEMGNTDPFTHGGDGNDYIDGGASGDLLYGDEGDDLVVGSQDQDIVQGNLGDDILRPGNPSQAINGGPDEVIGDDGYTNTGFDMIDFSDYVAGANVNADMVTQFNPLVNIDNTTTFPAWFQIEGVIGSQNNDTLIGTDALNPAEEANLFGGGNWLVGGSGNDTLQGNGGNDVIIGDGIRLDSLIGTYSGTYDYDDAYADASHRNSGVLQNNGLLDTVTGFDKHYTEMLKSAIFKDLELGGSAISTLNGVAGTRQGDGGTAGATDTVVFTGNRADYSVQLIPFASANDGTITAYKVTDIVAGRDGVDVVVGVEFFKFADGIFNEAAVLNEAPVITSDGGGATATLSIAENTVAVTTVVASDANAGDVLTYSISGTDVALFDIDANTGVLTFVNAPNFEAPVGGDNVYNVNVIVSDGIATDTQALAVTVTNVNEVATGALRISGYTTNANSASLTATNTIADPDGMTNFVQYQWQRQAANGTWSNIVGATNAALANQADTTVRVTSSYNDPFGANSFISDETAFITANNGNNTKVAGTGTDVLLGLGGNDVLTGAAGNDIVDGGSGDDRLYATVNLDPTPGSNDGNDVYIGGTGTDTYDLSLTSAGATVNLTTGTSTSAQTGTDTLAGIERVSGSSGNDTITDGAGVNRLEGNNGNDTFILTADTASDDIRGGAGVDTVDYSALTANLNVTLNGSTAATVNGTGVLIDIFGTLIDFFGKDQIRDVENFIGGSGNDTITGDTLNNALSGGLGNDLLRGGQGLDVLTGGLGNDTFDFNNINESGITAATRDQITDFQAGDKIDLQGIDASSAAGNGAFAWLGTAAFTAGNANGGLHYYYDSINNLTIVEGSVNASTTAEFQIELVGNITLAATDFAL